MTKSKRIYKRILNGFGILMVLSFLFVLFVLHVAFPTKYKGIISSSAKRFGVEEELIYAIIWTESKYDKGAKSPKGAIGLMQLLPSTASFVAKAAGYEQLSEEMLYEEEVNIEIGTYYLRYLFERFTDEEWVIAAYNAGEGNVSSWREEGKSIPFKETRDYIKRVNLAKSIYKFKSK